MLAPTRRRQVLIALPLILLVVGSLAWGSFHALRTSADLERRLEEVRLVWHQADPYDDPDATYPPQAMLPFTLVLGPLADAPAAARVTVWLLNLAAVGYIAHRLVALTGGGWRVSLVLLFVAAVAASKPVRLTLGMGQFSLIGLAAMLAAERDAERHRPALAGFWLALALMKPTMSLPLAVWLAVRGRWRALGVAAVLSLASWLLLAAWVGVDPLTLLAHWLDRARTQNDAGSIDLPSLLARLNPAWADLAPIVSLAVLLAISAHLARHRHRRGLAPVAFAAFGAAVMTYHRPYDLVLLLPALAQEFQAARAAVAAAGGSLRRRALALAPAAVLAILLVAPAKMPEAVYDALFIPGAYLFLGLAAWRLSRAPEPENDSTPVRASVSPVGVGESV